LVEDIDVLPGGQLPREGVDARLRPDDGNPGGDLGSQTQGGEGREKNTEEHGERTV
jgi:hypothetical protein